MTSKVFKVQRFVYCHVHFCNGTAVEHRSLLIRSGISEELSVVIFFFCSYIRFVYKNSVFEKLKYIPSLFSEYLLTFMIEEPMKMCVTN